MGELIELFVYGTLKVAGPLHSRIKSWVRGVRPGYVEGVLVSLGAFPALAPGHGIVRGELLLVAPEALQMTDLIEGFAPGRQHNFYRRKKATVRLDGGGETEAWVYEFAEPERIVDRPVLVVGKVAGHQVYEWQPPQPRQP